MGFFGCCLFVSLGNVFHLAERYFKRRQALQNQQPDHLKLFTRGALPVPVPVPIPVPSKGSPVERSLPPGATRAVPAACQAPAAEAGWRYW